MNSDTPAVALVNELITKAVEIRASDIHVEPIKEGARVRFRIDGLLHQENIIDHDLSTQVIARIKVLAHMNVAERRIPQDGKLAYKNNAIDIDIRIATFPSLWGEKLVVRILDKTQQALDINNLGFTSSMLDYITNIATSSCGFFLVTGPTGSGKTTTLHAMLSRAAVPEKNIVTLEDPIEYQVQGITQGQVYPEIGFTFERGIRALLRQDPDIIMVGEIRDRETAQVAIQAALTGHFVLSTLHTTNAPGALMRLLDMHIEPFLINAVLTGILAQRLVRKLCVCCRYECSPTTTEKSLLAQLDMPLQTIYKSRGCESCRGIGYKGRIGIFELLVISPALRALIAQGAHFKDIYAQACLDGMRPLSSDGVHKVALGSTSLDELIRVIF